MKEAAPTLAESADANTDLPTREKYYWLNEESRLFLSRGYITESPEQRIKDIANKCGTSTSMMRQQHQNLGICGDQ